MGDTLQRLMNPETCKAEILKYKSHTLYENHSCFQWNSALNWQLQISHTGLTSGFIRGIQIHSVKTQYQRCHIHAWKSSSNKS